jgi:predicted kinase
MPRSAIVQCMSTKPKPDGLPGTLPTRTEDHPTLREPDPVAQPKSDAPRPCGRIHLLVGPVGAGKSTFGLRLSQGGAAVRLTLDEWMTALFRPDRPETDVMPWYVERAARCVERIWVVARDIATTGTDVVLEIGLLRRRERERLYARTDAAGLRLTVHALDALRDVRRERVERRNREQGPTFAMVVPPDFFERASDFWEPLQPDECEGRDVRFLVT